MDSTWRFALCILPGCESSERKLVATFSCCSVVISCQWRTNQDLPPVQHDSAVLFEKPKALIQLFMMDSLFYVLRRSEENASRLGDAITVFVFVFSSGWQLSGRIVPVCLVAIIVEKSSAVFQSASQTFCYYFRSA